MTGATKRVWLHGLVVETDAPIAAQLATAEPQVRCSRRLDAWTESAPPGTVVARTQTFDGRTTMQVLSDSDAFIVDWPGFMRAEGHAALGELACDLQFSAATPTAAELMPVMISPAVGAVAMLRGALVLHATAVVIEGRAVLLLADQGGGKSSVAALLGSAGVPLLAEDVCALTTKDGMVVAHSGVQELRLRTTTPWLADLEGLRRSHPHPDGRIVVAPPTSDASWALAGSLMVVRLDSAATDVTVEAIPAGRAVGVVTASQRCVPVEPSLVRRSFNWVADVAASCPASILTVPWAADRRNKSLGLTLAAVLVDQLNSATRGK